MQTDLTRPVNRSESIFPPLDETQTEQGAIILRAHVSGMTVVAVGRVRQRVKPVIPIRHHRRIRGPGMGRPTGPGCVAVSIRQRQCSRATRAAAPGNVLGIARRDLLTLIPSQLDGLPEFGRHGAAVATLP